MSSGQRLQVPPAYLPNVRPLKSSGLLSLQDRPDPEVSLPVTKLSLWIRSLKEPKLMSRALNHQSASNPRARVQVVERPAPSRARVPCDTQ